MVIKKRHSRKILAIVFLVATICSSAQEAPVSEGGLLDTLYDRFGNKVSLLSASVNSGRQLGMPSTVNSGIPTSSCSAGYFNLYFVPNMVFGAVQNANMVAQAKMVVCQAFTDVSEFINTNSLSINASVGPKVNILVTSATSGNVASASPLFVFPPSPDNPNQGYIDGLVHQMLLTSADPYSSLPMTFTQSAAFTNGFFHGYLDFSPSLLHNYNLSITAAATGTLNDLYTVTLHEIGHLLGIGSLIGSTGTSILGVNNNFYSRWDAKLNDASGNPLLGPATLTSCISNLNYTASPTAIAPGGTCITDDTQCGTASQYSSTSVVLPLYTPNCFEVGSSLSHLEDMCSTSQFTPSNTTPCTTNTNLPGYTMYNNLYFLMTGQFFGCNTKRYFREEERQVLCDLGYSVKATYSSTSGAHVYQTVPFYAYAVSGCSTSAVLGVNDGVFNGSYVYTTTTNSISIPTQSILSNDYPTTGLHVSCVEIVYTNGTTQFSASLSSGSVVVSGVQGSGLAIVRYVPVNTAGQMGNATYIFAYFTDPGCNPVSFCNMVQNGDFESTSGTSCGVLETFPTPAATMDCWEEYPLGSKPYLYVRNCTNGGTYDLNNSTLGTGGTPINSFNGSPNDKAVAVNYTAGVGSSALKNHLSMPLIPGQTYDISFYALNHPGLSSSANTNTNNNSLVLTVAAHTVFPFVNPGQFPTGLVTIAQFTIPCTNNWAYYSQTFTLPTSIPVNLAGLVIGINSTQTALQGTWNNGMTAFCFLDNVSLVPSPAIQFVIPSQTLCGNQPIGDLDGIMTGTALTVFTGSAVTFNNGKYSFNLNSTLSPGDYWITSSYTLSGGCAGEAYHKISISTNTNYPVLTSTLLCTSSPTIDLNTLLSAPASVTGGTFYLNYAPVSTITSVPLGSVSLLAFSPAGSNLCSAFMPTASIGAYTVPESPLVQIGGAGFTSTVSCATGSLSLNASNTIGPYSYLWEPGSLIGANQTVNPSSPTIYTVNVFDSYSVCPATATLAVNAVTNCCNSSTVNALTVTSFTQATPISGPLLVGSSFTIEPGATLFMDGEFRFTSNASITIASGAVLNIVDAHLFACGDYMWPGIVVKDGGRMTMGGSLKDNLFEDALTAIDASDQFTTSVGTILDIKQTTFNRNHTSIRITNYDGNNNNFASPLDLQECVFSSRQFTFTSTQWPLVSTTGGGLRSATNPTTGIVAPYTLQGAALTKLKSPYGNYFSRRAIDLLNVAHYTNGNYYGVSVGSASVAAKFNLFDGHENFIIAENSNLKVENNVFQNTQRYYVPTTPGGTFLVTYYPVGAVAIHHLSTNTVNTMLNAKASSAELGNRFWDCHHSIFAQNTYSIEIEHAIFRSTQGGWTMGSTFFASWFGLNNLMPGQSAISLNTNRFRYNIIQNEISNINVGISMGLAPYPFSTMLGTAAYGIDAGALTIKHNTISPEPAGVTYTSGYSNIGISVAVPLSNTFSAVASSSLEIEDNHLDRVFRGISVNGMAGFPVAIRNNSITQATDSQFNAGQRGIELVNTIGTSSSCCNNVVEDNTISSVNPGNTLGALLYASMNAGPTSPRITCNILKDAMKGFVFSGPNPGTYWRGNKMEDLGTGMELRDAGVIGVQGSSVAPSDNEWNGAWPAGTYGTWTEGISTNALNSKLWVRTAAIPYFPPNNTGQFPTFSYTNPGNLQLSNSGVYTCGGGPNQIVLPLPQEEEYHNPNEFYIANTTLYRMLYLNPGLRRAGTDLENWFDNIDLGNAELFMQIEQNLSAGELSTAQSLINDISPVNAVEENYKTYYGLYIHFADEDVEFSSEDSTALFELAGKCPTKDGACIYQARALLQLLGKQPFYGFSDCIEDPGARKRQPEIPQASDLERWQVRLFPNPAYNSITIKTNRPAEKIEIRIRDVSGRLVYTNSVLTTDYKVQVELSVLPGIYTVEMTSRIAERAVKKLVVQR